MKGLQLETAEFPPDRDKFHHLLLYIDTVLKPEHESVSGNQAIRVMGFDLVCSTTKLFQKLISGSSYLKTGLGAFFILLLPKFVVKIILPL
jgi:hypothetical protein